MLCVFVQGLYEVVVLFCFKTGTITVPMMFISVCQYRANLLHVVGTFYATYNMKTRR